MDFPPPPPFHFYTTEISRAIFNKKRNAGIFFSIQYSSGSSVCCLTASEVKVEGTQTTAPVDQAQNGFFFIFYACVKNM